jgi:Na+/glutamate symporter
MSLAAGLVGLLAGGALGYVNARVIAGVVIKALEATDRSANETERADYRARIRLFWLIVHVVFIAGGMAVGWGLSRWLFD